MANLVVPTEGTLNVIAYLAYQFSQVGAKVSVKLFKNDHTPTKDTVLANLTEANFSGYAPVLVTGWDFSGTVLDSAGRAVTRADNTATFTHNGGGVNNTIYGAYVVDNVGDLLWVQRLDDAPVAMDASGRFVAYVPLFTLRSQYEHA